MATVMAIESLKLIHTAHPLSLKATEFPDLRYVNSEVFDSDGHYHYLSLFIHENAISFTHAISKSHVQLYYNEWRIFEIKTIEWYANFINELEN